MPNLFQHIQVRNFRSLANVDIDLGAVNVLFGPNGAGKSNFLDTIWFIRDCTIRGVEAAASDRSHGIGMLWIGSSDRTLQPDEKNNIAITLETQTARYTVEFGYSSGRIEAFVGEKLYSKTRNILLLDRKLGSDKADFYHNRLAQMASLTLREPEKLALSRYLGFEDTSTEALELDRLLRFIHFYKARDADIYSLKKRGSESSYQTWVWDRGQNLWSVLRNLKDRRELDDRYNTIIEFMRRAFPEFQELIFEQTGTASVYGHFIEKQLPQPIQASGVSDGHLQMLMHLTCLFAEGENRESTLIFDEPEISLHPAALAQLAQAMNLAAQEWNKQILIATHSPVLMSQFEPNKIWAIEKASDKQTIMNRIDRIPQIQDLLQEYALGSLYMAELVAPQSSPSSSDNE